MDDWLKRHAVIDFLLVLDPKASYYKSRGGPSESGKSLAPQSALSVLHPSIPQRAASFRMGKVRSLPSEKEYWRRREKNNLGHKIYIFGSLLVYAIHPHHCDEERCQNAVSSAVLYTKLGRKFAAIFQSTLISVLSFHDFFRAVLHIKNPNKRALQEINFQDELIATLLFVCK